MALNKLTRVNKLVTNLTATDVGALAKDAQAKDAALLGGKTKEQIVEQARVGLVDETRQINGHALNADVTLTHTDVGAAAADHDHDYVPNSDKGAVNGVATLDASGKIPQTQLPAIAIKETFPVDSEAAMLALNAQTGDMAIRSDIRQTFVLMQAPANVVANWKELLTPTDLVQSVNGQRGVVVLGAADVGAEPAFEKNSAFNKEFGTTADTVMQGNDSRVVNAVPNTRTVNGHNLGSNIILTAADVGALGADAQAADSALLEGKTKTEVIAEARDGLALAGASYTKAESDEKYQAKTDIAELVKGLINTVDVVVEAEGNTVTLPAGEISAVLVMTVSGVMQTGDFFSYANNVLTLGEALQAGDVVTVIGFK